MTLEAELVPKREARTEDMAAIEDMPGKSPLGYVRQDGMDVYSSVHIDSTTASITIRPWDKASLRMYSRFHKLLGERKFARDLVSHLSLWHLTHH